jgi:cation:H+ antiporter
MSPRLLRPLLLCTVLSLPAVVLRVSGVHAEPVLALLLFGGAVVAASFLLAWAAEAVQVDISGGLAIALLAFIAVLPEYAVDLYFAYAAGSKPEYAQYAAANLTGANQLVLGLGWPLVGFVALRALRRKTGKSVREIVLEPRRRVELAVLGVSGVLAFVMPVSRQIHLALAIVLLALFAFYLWQISRGGVTEPELIGTPARLAALPRRRRRRLLASVFVFSAVAVPAPTEPFAHALIDTGTQLGIDKFLLVQWLAPLASEAPELIVAVLLARRANADDALGTLLSSKVNQWTLLVGSIPLAYLAGGGGLALPLDGRQVEEVLLTSAQTMLGFAVLLRLRFPRWASATVLTLFVTQFAFHGVTARYVISGVYGVLAVAAFIANRDGVLLMMSPFAAAAGPARAALGRSARGARRVTVTVVGVVVLAVGAVLLVAPGPGLIVVALGLVVLGTEYEWARRHAQATLHRARRAADLAAARPAAMAGTATFAIGLMVLGVALAVVDSLPGSGVTSGASIGVSGVAVLASLIWAARRRQAQTGSAGKSVQKTLR